MGVADAVEDDSVDVVEVVDVDGVWEQVSMSERSWTPSGLGMAGLGRTVKGPLGLTGVTKHEQAELARVASLAHTVSRGAKSAGAV